VKLNIHSPNTPSWRGDQFKKHRYNFTLGFGNRVLRRILGPKGKKVAGGWRRLHNEELHNLYALPMLLV
jgi:hypothetical protein